MSSLPQQGSPQFDFNDGVDNHCDDIVVGGGVQPIYKTPTSSFQLWVNQYAAWHRVIFPEKRSLTDNKTLTELANAMWKDSKGEVGQLMSLIHDQRPVIPPKEHKAPVNQVQKRLGAFFATIEKEKQPPLVGSSMDVHIGKLGNSYNLSEVSDNHQSPLKPPLCNTGGNGALLRCLSNTAEVRPVITVQSGYYLDYMDRTSISFDRFLCWLLGDEYLDWMPIWLKKNCYRNSNLNSVVTLWVTHDFSKLVEEYSHGMIRKTKKYSQTNLCVRSEVAARLACKVSVQEALQVAKEQGKDDSNLKWMENLQAACDTYYCKLSPAIGHMKKSILNRKAHRNKIFQIDKLEKTFRIKMNNNAEVSWQSVTARYSALAEYPDTTSKTTSPLLPSQLLTLRNKIKGGMLFVRVDDELLESVAPNLPQDEVIQAIARCFPVVVLQCGSNTVIVDLHAMRTDEDWMEMLWLDVEADKSQHNSTFLADTWPTALKPKPTPKP